ncbi:MAG: GNAT family N-acetyltransferase [Draconibacterium sp.]|nr:GNAT family N-acetyltransferase [Draconibacterium sp.]
MEITYRPISASDLHFLKNLYRSTREEELDTTDWNELQKERFIEFQFNAQHSHYVNSFERADFLLIKLKKTDIGRLYLWKTDSQIRILDITLLEKYRRKEIGTKIITALIHEANKTGKKLNLHVGKNNPALKLYERLGFKRKTDTDIDFFMEKLPEEKT